ncbi:hypothetical protein [Neobacillus mesonae]|uniref:hypothetical protein n=1 Tax=Neobacillus mesonae TaxID=1193713 RepID=UPI0025744332|nr:hypothetical protein [Neobacillus mesonae]
MIDFYQDCVILETKKDVYGKNQVVKEIPCKCRVKEKFEMIVNQNAENVVSQISFTIPVDVDVKLGYKIKYQNETYTILSIKISRNLISEVARKVVYV